MYASVARLPCESRTIWGPHWFETDEGGSLYVAEDYSGRIQKFRRAAWAAPTDPQLIGPLVR